MKEVLNVTLKLTPITMAWESINKNLNDMKNSYFITAILLFVTLFIQAQNPLLRVDGDITENIIYEEGFEDGTLAPYTEGGDTYSEWRITSSESNTGNYSAFAFGVVCNYNPIYLQTTVNVPSGKSATVSFAFNPYQDIISSNSGIVTLDFSIDGFKVGSWEANSLNNYVTIERPLSSGNHILKWEAYFCDGICIERNDSSNGDFEKFEEQQGDISNKVLIENGVYIDDIKIFTSDYLVEITDGNQGNNKILVSDEYGKATWKSPNEWLENYPSDLKLGGNIATGKDELFRICNNNSAYNSMSWIELWGCDDNARDGELTLAGSYVSIRAGSNKKSNGREILRVNSAKYPYNGGSLIHINGTNYDNDNRGGVLRIQSGNGAQNLYLDGNEIDAVADGLFLNNNTDENIILCDGGGNVGIDTRAINYKLEVNGSAGKPGGGSWSNSSDRRLKTGLKDFNLGLDIVEKVNPVYFHYNGIDSLPTDKEYVGVIAQQLQKIAPFMVSDYEGGNGETYLAVDPSAFDFILINAAKELQTEVSKLKKENDLLKKQIGEIASIKQDIQLLKKRISIDVNATLAKE